MLRTLGIIAAVLLVLVLAGLSYVRVTGLRARVEPGPLETRVARSVRALAVTAADRDRRNPVPASAEALESGLVHFADHCAICHGNDGSGDTDFGRGLYPPPPDMRREDTQELTDGELFHIIEHGIRFTGMPGFGGDHAEGEEETWELVHFIRHLPRLSDPELERMRELNPRPPAEIRREMEEERFLRGEP
jgi:mono/diheme cytochrome c family protein